MSYKGYSNYLTWLCDFCLNNKEGLQKYFEELMKDQELNDYEKAEDLKNMFEELVYKNSCKYPRSSYNDLVLDIIDSGLKEINYLEIIRTNMMYD